MDIGRTDAYEVMSAHSTNQESGAFESESGSHPVSVSIMVVSYNTREMTLECLRSLQKEAAGLEYELLFLDNASSDDSFEAVEAEFGDTPRFNLKHSRENLGFAKANNQLALEARGEFLLLLNPDTVVLEDAIQNLLRFAQKKRERLIWGGRTITADGTLDKRSCCGSLTLLGLFFRTTGIKKLFHASEFFNSEEIGSWNRDTEREVGWITGCFMLIERALWNRLDGFAPAFFMYGEEAEMQIRARKLGARPTLTPEATIIHHGHGSSTTLWKTRAKIMRGEITIINYHWKKPAGWAGRKLIYINAFTRYLSFNILAKLNRQAGAVERAKEWTDLWKNRKEWLKGY